MGWERIVCALLLWSVACGVGVGEDRTIRLAVDPEGPEFPSGQILGWDLEIGMYYAPPWDPFNPDWRTPQREEAINALRQMQMANGLPATVRTGGMIIDAAITMEGYHFRDYLDPVQREIDPNAFYQLPPYSYLLVVEELAGEPIVTLNYSTASVAESRDYTVFLNHTIGTLTSASDRELIGLRQVWRHAEPYNVRRFEIGNEVYSPGSAGWWAIPGLGRYSYANPWSRNGGDPEWYNRPSSEPSHYAARCLALIDSIDDPGAKFTVQFNLINARLWGGLDSLIEDLRPLLEDERVDQIALHHYTMQESDREVELAPFVSEVDTENYAVILGAMDYFEDHLLEIKEALESRLVRETPISMAITEYGITSNFQFFLREIDETLGFGLGLADMMLTFLKTGVSQAHLTTNLWFEEEAPPGIPPLLEVLFPESNLRAWNLFRLDDEGQLVRLPGFWAQDLIARHTQSIVVPIEADSMPEVVLEQGRHEWSYPAVHVVATRNEEGSVLDYLLLNRSLDLGYPIRLELPPGFEVESSEILTSPHVSDDAMTTPIECREFGLSITPLGARLILPAHSLVGIRLARSGS